MNTGEFNRKQQPNISLRSWKPKTNIKEWILFLMFVNWTHMQCGQENLWSVPQRRKARKLCALSKDNVERCIFRVLLQTHSLSLCTYLLYVIFFPVPLCGDQGSGLFCSVRHWGFWWGSESKESGRNGSSTSLPKIFIWVLLDKWRKRLHFHIFIFRVQLSLIYEGVPRILTGPLFPVPSSSVSTSRPALPGPQTFSTR